MADFTALKTAIQTYIKQNGNEEITGEILQEILLSVVTTLGDGAINNLSIALNTAITNLQNSIGEESSARQSQSSALSHSLNIESQTRAYTDQQLQMQINGIRVNIDDFLEQVRQLLREYEPIIINGDVVNAPDENDLTTTANNLLKFKDNVYNPILFSGMGKKFLRKNLRPLSVSYDFDGFVENVSTQAELSGTPEHIYWDRTNEYFVGLKNGVYYLAWTDDDAFVPASTSNLYMYGGEPYRWNGTDFYLDDEDLPNVRNLLTQDMINEANTIYIIRYDYTLKENITIPANCVLQFDGGSISGAYTLTGENTGISADLVKIFNTNVTLAGTWNITEVYSEWFGAVGDGVTEDTQAIQKAAIFAYGKTLKFLSKTYLTDTINLSPNPDVDNIEQNCARIICGSGSVTTALKAKTTTTVLLNMRNVTNRTLKDIYLIGHENCLLLNADITFQAAPSAQNRFDNIRFRNFGLLGANFNAQNDSVFNKLCFEHGDTEGYCFSALGKGGYFSFNNIFTRTKVKITCQTALFYDCILSGIEINGNGWNCLGFSGCYIYADNNNRNFILNSLSHQITLTASHVENPGGVVFWGSNDNVCFSILYNGGHLFSTVNENAELLGGSFLTTNKTVIVSIQGVYINKINLQYNLGRVKISNVNCNYGGTVNGGRQIISSPSTFSFLETNIFGVGCYNNNIGQSGLIISSVLLSLSANTVKRIPIGNGLKKGTGLLFLSYAGNVANTECSIVAISNNSNTNDFSVSKIIQGTKQQDKYTLSYDKDGYLCISSTISATTYISCIWRGIYDIP